MEGENKKIYILKQVNDQAVEQGVVPVEARSFNWKENHIRYEPELVEMIKFFSENILAQKDCEIFETKGNYAFTSEGIFIAVFEDGLDEPETVLKDE